MTGPRIRPIKPEPPKVWHPLGRPKVLVNDRRISFRMTDEVRDKLRRIGGNMSAGIRIAVLAYREPA